MATFNMTFKGGSNIPISFNQPKSMNASFGQVYQVITSDYNQLNNLPSINGQTIIGDMSSSDFNIPIFLFDTTENWAEKGTEISALNTIYVYTDYKKTDDEKDIAGIKVGDGKAYIVDLPFIDEAFIEHAADTTIHITQAEREFWNNKNRAIADGENLILTTL